MRLRATATAVTAAALGAALAVTALAGPAAGATQDDSPTRFSDIVVNKRLDYTVVVGAKEKVAFLVSATVNDPSGVRSVTYGLWHGDTRAQADGYLAQVGSGRCVKASATTSKCEAVVVADPNSNLRSNALAGVWTVGAVAVDGAGNVTRLDDVGTGIARIKRETQLSRADATPEPVKKGRTVTVRARMAVASWEQHKDVPLIGHQVLLQFRKGRSGAFVTLQKVKTDRNGWAKASVKATVDGEYRFNFAGTSLTRARTGAADFVDVK
ncbi:calcium-binding protein [Streptomyces adustus]|uniref:calcium-binding protein n=1 Tax=Streptomyces adustus TaxID=1609272 RepID=UPI0012E0012F|nr:calcium-binding protein [Streptomyces adustus]